MNYSHPSSLWVEFLATILTDVLPSDGHVCGSLLRKPQFLRRITQGVLTLNSRVPVNGKLNREDTQSGYCPRRASPPAKPLGEQGIGYGWSTARPFWVVGKSRNKVDPPLRFFLV